MMDTETVAEIEAVVGKIEGKLTAAQALLWSKHMAAETDSEFARALGDTAAHFFAPKYPQHWMQNPDLEDEQATSFAAAMVARSAHAMKFFLERNQTGEFVAFLSKNPLPGFAGDKVPFLKFPAANCWFEVAFKPGEYPAVVPQYDHSSMAQIRVANLAIHTVTEGAIEPEPGGEYKHAQILAFVTDALGQVHTYAGIIEYGARGANVQPIRNHTEAFNAYSGLPVITGLTPKRMSNLSQFVCGTLAHLLLYFDAAGGIMLTPETESTENLRDQVNADTNPN